MHAFLQYAYHVFINGVLRIRICITYAVTLIVILTDLFILGVGGGAGVCLLSYKHGMPQSPKYPSLHL